MDSWVVLLIIALLSFIGRARRRSQSPPERRRPPPRQVPLPELQVPKQQPSPSGPPPPLGSELPEELEDWDDESEIPAAWLPDVEPPPPEPPPAGESPGDLLQRLSRAAEAALRDREPPAPAAASHAATEETAAPIQTASPPPSVRLSQLRQRLSSPTSLREALLLKEILGPPRARRPGPFRT